MADKHKFLKNIKEEIEEIGSKDLEKVARRVYTELPYNDKDLIESFDFLVSKDDWSIFWPVTQWIKRRELSELEYMKYFEKLHFSYVKNIKKRVLVLITTHLLGKFLLPFHRRSLLHLFQILQNPLQLVPPKLFFVL